MFRYAVGFLAVALLHSSCHAATLPRAPPPSSCNGRPEYCSRKYSNVSQIGAHDSPFSDTRDSITYNISSLRKYANYTINQDRSVEQQLNDGIRFLQLQVQSDGDGNLQMCHTSCALFNAGNLASYLSVIEAWLSRPANAREILTLLLVNSNDLGANQFGKSFTDAGLQNYTFQPASNPNALAFRDWPTLQQMIDAGTRLVVFMDSQADVTTVPYILPEWDYFFETPYDVTNASSLDQGCPLDRPANTQPDGKMYIVNHFLDETAAFLLGATVPDIDLLPQTNAATGFGSIGNQVQSCEQIYEQPPKFVLVDFYDKGDVFVAEKKMNGVSSPN